MPNKNCRICTSPTEIWKDTISRYYHCPACGFIFRDPAAILSPEEEKSRYELHDNSLESPGFRKYLNNFIEEGLRPLKPGTRILDFGSGPEPSLSRLMQDEGAEVTGYDPYFYRNHGYRNHRYDIIVLHEVIEHIADPLPTLIGLRPLLAAGGRFLIRTEFAPVTEAEFTRWWYRADRTHVSFFASETLPLLAEKLQLRLEIKHPKHLFALLKNKEE